MKHLFAIAVLVLAASGWAVGDAASDERELTHLVKDLNAAIVKPDIAFLERVLAKDYVHYRPHGNVETRAQYLEDRKSGSVDFDSLVADEIKVRLYGDTAAYSAPSFDSVHVVVAQRWRDMARNRAHLGRVRHLCL